MSNKWWRSRFFVGSLAALLHSFACFFYVGMATLHLYIKNEPIAALTLGFTGVDLLRYFDFVIAASIVLAVLHGIAVVVKFAQWDHALENKCGADSYELLVLVEIGLQTYQAYKMSHLIATRWINRLVVLAIVANCWFVPGVSVVFRKKPPSYVKVVQLALDAVIEVVFGMVIPLTIFYPYYRDAMLIMHSNPYDPFLGWYMDTWYINAIAENLQLYVSSWIDFVSKMAPGFSLLLRLSALRSQRAEHETRTRTAKTEVIASGGGSVVVRKKRFLIGLMSLWGFGVLVTHLAATVVSLAGSDPGCLLEMVSFGSAQYTCVVMEVSCTQKRIAGTKSEVDAVLNHVDPLSVQVLIFSHCQMLSMPPRLKAFPNLVEIKIHNSSIAEWGDDAALTAQHHPAFQTLYVTLTNMSRIPDGVLSSDSPPIFSDIELCGTNLTSIPDDVFDKWPGMVFFFLERSPGITEFPQALRKLSSPATISLAMNAITELPDDIFVHREYYAFVVSGNLAVRLPNDVGSAFAAVILSFASTQIETVPVSWVTADEDFKASGNFVVAQDTPLCTRLEAIRSQSTGSASDGSETLPWVQCDGSTTVKTTCYPLDLELQQRERNRM